MEAAMQGNLCKCAPSVSQDVFQQLAGAVSSGAFPVEPQPVRSRDLPKLPSRLSTLAYQKLSHYTNGVGAEIDESCLDFQCCTAYRKPIGRGQ
mmetsp:Transcript_34455/g.75409  ORF Transcript_34455/g.75409 Transcript_34455/m.75409 type:complete len:93 (+) Transcript_34455:477-755(+)